MSIDPTNLRQFITKTLKKVPGFYSENAVELLMLTNAVETDGGRYIYQIGEGPGLGIMSVEPKTMRDNYDNFLRYRDGLLGDIREACGMNQPSEWMLECNMAFNVLMARLKYWRVPLPIPVTIEGKAKYHEKYYNTVDNYVGPDWEVSVAKYRKYCC